MSEPERSRELPGVSGAKGVADMVAESRRAQGLPERIADRAVLVRLATLLTAPKRPSQGNA
jgi:hypothetical protein